MLPRQRAPRETTCVAFRGRDLDAFGVRELGLGVGAGLQRLVEVVDGLAGGVLHGQQTVVGHPAPVEGLRAGWGIIGCLLNNTQRA